jgi:hypothetical protein
MMKMIVGGNERRSGMARAAMCSTALAWRARCVAAGWGVKEREGLLGVGICPHFLVRKDKHLPRLGFRIRCFRLVRPCRVINCGGRPGAIHGPREHHRRSERLDSSTHFKVK